ncbi:MAG: VanW family protein [Actinomycetota bacterium]|nr:VanW family protein [Actinomycetota bacterium]
MSEQSHWQWPVWSSRRWILLGLGAILLVLVAYVGAVLLAGSGIARGTSVLGIDIGGMSTAETTVALKKGLASNETTPITVKSLKRDFPILPSDAGLSFDVESTVEQASSRTWNPIALFTGLFATRTLDPVVLVNQDSLSAQVDAIATVIDRAPVEPMIDMKGLKPVEIPGATGREIDDAAASSAIVDAFATGKTSVTVSPAVANPTVSDDALLAAKAVATQAVSAPVQVQVDGISARLGPRAIARSLTFSAEDGQLVPILDGGVLHKAIAEQIATVEAPGRDATFVIENGVPVIVPSKVGKGVSDEELATAVGEVIGMNPPDRTVTVTVGVREPQLTTEQAQQLGVKERLSTFTQAFPYAAYRKQNIGEAARRLNGTVVLPGETFSMNETIKERTVANGYTVGFVIGQGGIFDEDLGGGVSTAVTATWTAAFYAGMEPVQVVAHSIFISRYKPGLEATVAWGSFDMKFKNPYPNAVYIQASAGSTSINVSIWGTPEYSDIKAESGPRTNIVKYKTIYDQSSTCLGQGGMDGFNINVDRVFYKDGVEVKRETISTKYKPSPEVICGKEKKPGTTFRPSPSPSASGTRKPSKSPSPTPSSGDAAPAFPGVTSRSGLLSR